MGRYKSQSSARLWKHKGIQSHHSCWGKWSSHFIYYIFPFVHNPIIRRSQTKFCFFFTKYRLIWRDIYHTSSLSPGNRSICIECDTLNCKIVIMYIVANELIFNWIIVCEIGTINHLLILIDVSAAQQQAYIPIIIRAPFNEISVQTTIKYIEHTIHNTI